MTDRACRNSAPHQPHGWTDRGPGGGPVTWPHCPGVQPLPWAGRGFSGPPEPLSYADLDPKPLRQQLRDVLSGLGMATLTELESMFIPGIHRNDLIEELARMRDDGEVEFTGPRYKLVDRQAGH